MLVEDGGVRLVFDHAAGGLVTVEDGPATGFALAGEDRVFFRAEARVEGDAVLLRSARVPQPAAARYLFYDGAPASLFNAAGLPALPFRTDDWPWDIPAPEERRAGCARTEAAPVLDGIPEAAAWPELPATGFTRVHSYRPAARKTRVRVGWDDVNLYVCFQCAGMPAGDIDDKVTDAFWRQDYVELLVDPALDRRNYLRFAVNPAGALFSAQAYNDAWGDEDLLCQDWLGGKRWIDKAWDGGARAAAVRGAHGWSVELAVPWASMAGGAPRPGREIGVQFMRYDAAGDEYSEWAVTGRDRNTGAMMPPAAMGGFTMYHAPSRFGTLTLE
jgi:hypothetical protein